MALFNFDVVKRAIGDVGAQLRKLREEREHAMRQREDLQSLPLAKGDFQALLESWVDRQGAGFVERLQTGAGHYLKNPLSTIPENPKAPCQPIWILTATRNPEDMITHVGLEGNLFALMAPALKQGIRAVVDEMDFSQAGPERSERLQIIEALDAKIVELDNQEKALLEAAESAGVRL